ncbi:MAG: sulfotransferase [Candidatus Sedimenticola sp. 20ELBAFRAG]
MLEQPLNSNTDLIYIAGDDRSGSTLLDMMLAGHSQITSLGEAYQLRAFATGNRDFYPSVHELVCFCGQSLDECSFWKKVAENIDRPLDSLELKPFYLRRDHKNIFNRLLKKLLWASLHFYPEIYESKAVDKLLNGPRIAKDSFELYDAAAKASGSRYILDSSKSPLRLRSLIHQDPERIKLVNLFRDPRGVVYSKSKRGLPLRKAARQWQQKTRQMLLYSHALSPENVLNIRYEDLCHETETEIKRICSFLDLAFEPETLKRNIHGVHHLGGSPSKYAGADTPIILDESYKEHLTPAQTSSILKITRNEAAKCGYTF